MNRKLTILALCMFYLPFLYAQTPEWQKDLESMLYEFMSCGGPTASNTPCNEFLAKALVRVYSIHDFDKPEGRFMLADEIANYVSLTPDKWTLLGKASDQKALDEAQGYANLKKPVIAVYSSSTGSGHVVLILPGSQTASGSWGLKCPNSASFFINKPEKAYISKPLSFAFDAGLKSQVLLYGRNY